MATFYEEMAEIANEVLEEFRQDVSLVAVTWPDRPIDWPEWEPWNPTPSVKVYGLNGAVSAIGGAVARLVDGETVKATDLVVVLGNKMKLLTTDGVLTPGAPIALDACLLDTLRIDGHPVTIVRDISVPASGTRAAYKFIVRA